MLIMGIDPGSRYCGYSLLQVESRRIIAAGCDVINLTAKKSLVDRLVLLYQELVKLIDEYKPDTASVETIFYGKNIQTSFTLGQVRGVVLLALGMAKIDIHEYSPREIKKALTGKGGATKEQVKYMVEKMVPLSQEIVSLDAADAMAAALCHFNKIKFLGKV